MSIDSTGPTFESGIIAKKAPGIRRDELVARSLELSKYKNLRVLNERKKNMEAIRSYYGSPTIN